MSLRFFNIDLLHLGNMQQYTYRDLRQVADIEQIRGREGNDVSGELSYDT